MKKSRVLLLMVFLCGMIGFSLMSTSAKSQDTYCVDNPGIQNWGHCVGEGALSYCAFGGNECDNTMP